MTDGVDVTVKLISYHSDHKAAVIASFLRQLAECLDVKDVKHNDIHRHTPRAVTVNMNRTSGSFQCY